MRISTTARLALLAVLLSLVTSLALAGLIWQQTHDDAIDTLRRDTAEQADAFAAVYRSGGMPALAQAIAEAQADDDSLVAALVDGKGARRLGVGPDRLAFPPSAE